MRTRLNFSIKHRESMQPQGKIVEARYYCYQTCKGDTIACSACFHGLYTLNRRLYYWWFIALESIDVRWYHGAPLVPIGTHAPARSTKICGIIYSPRAIISLYPWVKLTCTAFIISWKARSNIIVKVKESFCVLYVRYHGSLSN